MAVIWETVERGDHYQVRTAGRSVRLYKNDVFHSQWNETRPLSGGVWDLLFVPSLFMPAESVKRVLVLGVGGGAVIRQYLTFSPIEQIVGVELDPVHLKVATDYFGVNQSTVELVCADAVEWVKDYRGPGFDIVIEDLFTELDGEPVRVEEATADWFRQLRKLLRAGGSLIINFEDPAQLRDSGQAYIEAIADSPDHRFGLTLPTYGNCVGVFLATQGNPVNLRKNLDYLLNNYPSCRGSGQKFRVRRVVPK